jgi:hypothetical protein
MAQPVRVIGLYTFRGTTAALVSYSILPPNRPSYSYATYCITGYLFQSCKGIYRFNPRRKAELNSTQRMLTGESASILV